MSASDADASAVLLLLVWFVFTAHLGVCDQSTVFRWDIFVTDDMEGLSAFDSLFHAGGILSDALAETPKFVYIQCVPDVFIFRMATESIIFE